MQYICLSGKRHSPNIATATFVEAHMHVTFDLLEIEQAMLSTDQEGKVLETELETTFGVRIQLFWSESRVRFYSDPPKQPTTDCVIPVTVSCFSSCPHDIKV